MSKNAWTPWQIDMLQSLYADNQTEIVSEQIGRTVASCYAKAAKLGLKKSAEFFEAGLSGRLSPGQQPEAMKAGRFHAGSQPWNKGTHWVAGGRSAETRFKRGRRPEEARNYLPIGSLRMNHDGCLERKVTDDQSLYPARRWVAEHRLVWQAAHGPIPDGYMVAFRPGMRTTVAELITVDRLECISRADNARRNHPRNKSPELAKLFQLKGAITRQVNRIHK
jgi:HNH endonuclease